MFVRDWIVSLVGNRCAFCGERILTVNRACQDCLIYLLEFSKQSRLETSLSIDFRVYSALPYSDPVKKMILNNKRMPHSFFIEHFTDEMVKKLPDSFFKNSILVPVPGSAFDEPHLVEGMTTSFQKRGIACASLFVRKPYRLRPQKSRNENERRNLDQLKQYRLLKKNLEREIILFDDVCTTGSTLLSLKNLIESKTSNKVSRAVTIAFTERKY